MSTTTSWADMPSRSSFSTSRITLPVPLVNWARLAMTHNPLVAGSSPARPTAGSSQVKRHFARREIVRQYTPPGYQTDESASTKPPRCGRSFATANTSGRPLTLCRLGELQRPPASGFDCGQDRVHRRHVHRECVGGLVDRSITGDDLIDELDRLAAVRGIPRRCATITRMP